MSTSVSSSPITLLLGGAAPAAISPDAAGSQASNAKASGGFDLLLSALAGQQNLLSMIASPVADTAIDAAVTTGEAANPAATEGEESGIVLPIAGMFLPFAAAPMKTAEAPIHASKNSDGDDKESSSEDDAGIALLNVSAAAPATPLNVAQPSATTDAAMNTEAAMVELAAIAGAAANTTKSSKAGRDASANVVAATQIAGDKSGAVATDDGINNQLTIPNAVVDVEGGDAVGGFDALMKQFDMATSRTDTNSASGGVVQLGEVRNAAPASTHTAATTSAATTATVSVPVGANGWDDAVADKVMWFSANKINSAEIHLNPSDLGPVQVRISTQNDQTTVAFSSPHAAVREALDQALPRLRDMMGSQGIQLADVSVGGHGAERQQHSRDNGYANNALPTYFADDETSEPVAVSTVNGGKISRSAVDAYV